MTVRSFVADVLRQGVELWAEEGSLCYRAEEGTLTPSLLEELGRRKAELLRMLGRDRYLYPSTAQQRYWLLEQIEPNTAANKRPALMTLPGRFPPAVVVRSLGEIARRHEPLRTRFLVLDGQPVQVISPAAAVDLPVVDLRRLLAPIRRDAIRSLLDRSFEQPFDLTAGRLLHAVLIRSGEDEQELLVTMHQVVADRWGLEVFARELATLCRAFAAGQPSPLPEPTFRHSDFCHWENRWLQGTAAAEQLGYWRQQLADLRPALDLPTRCAAGAARAFAGAKRSFTIPGPVVDALADLSRDAEATLFMTLAAAWATVLYRYTGHDDLPLGTAVANRNHPGMEALIGCFVNLLVLRADLSGNPTFHQLLHRVQQTALAAYRHRDLPIEKLLDELRPQRDSELNPLFRVMLNYVDGVTTALGSTELTVIPVRGEWAATVDLVMTVMRVEQGFEGILYYRGDFCDGDTVAQLLRSFDHLLRNLTAHLATPIDRLPLMSAEDRLAVLSSSARTISPPTVAAASS